MTVSKAQYATCAHAIKHNEYGLGARLLLGELVYKKEQYKDAAVEYLEALELADSMTVPQAQADSIRQLYEPLLESQQHQKDQDLNRRLCENIRGLLMRPDWRDQIHKTREHIRRGQDADTLAPLAEVMLQAQSSSVIESMNQHPSVGPPRHSALCHG